MRIVLTADLHGDLPDIPECDLLLIAGDVCPLEDHDEDYQARWMSEEFTPWLFRQPARHKVLVAGNHDFVCQREDFNPQREEFGAVYLQDSLWEIDGLRIWGTPWVSALPKWAFHIGDDEARERFSAIPEDVDVVLSHGPPAGIGDLVGQEHTGSSILASRIQRVTPTLFVSGHIHECGGEIRQIGETTFVNASRMDKDFLPRHDPIQIDLIQTEKGWKTLLDENS